MNVAPKAIQTGLGIGSLLMLPFLGLFRIIDVILTAKAQPPPSIPSHPTPPPSSTPPPQPPPQSTPVRRDPLEDYRRLLGVPPGTKPEAIKQRFHFLSHAFHPDKFPDPKQKEHSRG